MDRCEICGFPGMMIEVIILGPNGQHSYSLVHIACAENRKAEVRMETRAKARWN